MMGGNVANMAKSKDEEGFAIEPSKDFAIYVLSYSEH